METSTLTLFSAKDSNRSGSDISDYTYYVNWGAIIPEKYKNNKFLINFSYYSDVTSNSASKTSFICANGLNLISANFQGFSNVLGCIPISTSRTTSVCVYGASMSDNPPVMGNYPNSNNLEIKIFDVTTFSSQDAVGILPNYMLTITFTPIKD
jgi:hypothetical protein